MSLYDACDLTYFSTTVPRTLESECINSTKTIKRTISSLHGGLTKNFMPLSFSMLYVALLPTTGTPFFVSYPFPRDCLSFSFRRSCSINDFVSEIEEDAHRNSKQRVLRFFERSNEILTSRLKDFETESHIFRSLQRTVRLRNC